MGFFSFVCFAYAVDEDDCTALECYVNAECVFLEDGAMCQCLKGFTRKGKSCYGNKNITITFEKLWIGGGGRKISLFPCWELGCVRHQRKVNNMKGMMSREHVRCNG